MYWIIDLTTMKVCNTEAFTTLESADCFLLAYGYGKNWQIVKVV